MQLASRIANGAHRLTTFLHFCKQNMKGFVHSTPVPQIYKAAATVAELVQEKGQSIKELVFSKKYSRLNVKGLYALIVETLQHESILCDIIRESKILADGRMKPWLARVLITELLWGKKKLPPNDCKPIQAVLDLQPEFIAILKKAVLDGTHANEPRINKALTKPRYVRVNTLKISVDEAVEAFLEEGWYEAYPDDPKDYASFLSKLANIGECEFVRDFHVPEVFAFPPRTEFFRHWLYTSGHLVLQDKATCLAAFLLDPKPGSVVLDMCAAPGLKTTQLAAITGNQGKLYAVEKSLPRYRTLVDFAARHDAEISPVNADASTLTATTMPDVEYVLVDPSCSGSGMQRPDSNEFDRERVAKLAGFQVILLERALTKFPSVKRVVYSTCSNYVEENEQVVEKVMKTINPNPAKPNYKLADVLTDSWLSRGSSDYECGPKCLYANEDVDLTTGFFLAVFDRIGSGDLELGGKRKRIRGKKMREKTHQGKEPGTDEREEKVDDEDLKPQDVEGEENLGFNGVGKDIEKEKGRKKKKKRNGFGPDKDSEEVANEDLKQKDVECEENWGLSGAGKDIETEGDGNLGFNIPGTDNDERKKKKKKKTKDLNDDEVELVGKGKFEDVDVKEKREKKKRKRNEDDENEVVMEGKARKKRKKQKLEKGETLEVEVNEDVVRRKKKKKSDKDH